MEETIICPYCYIDQNSYKCEINCVYCNTLYCLICNKPFYIINNISNKGHFKNCYITSKL